MVYYKHRSTENLCLLDNPSTAVALLTGVAVVSDALVASITSLSDFMH